MKKYLILLSTITFLSCNRSPELNGFDQDKWQSDTEGCKGYRTTLIDTLLQQKDQLHGLSQNQIGQFLGKADKHELYERSQKFFIYNVEPGNNCSNTEGDYYRALYIRFNSLDQAVAFTIQEVR